MSALTATTTGRTVLPQPGRPTPVRVEPSRNAAHFGSWPTMRRDLLIWVVLSDLAAALGPAVIATTVSAPMGALTAGGGLLLVLLTWACGALGVDVIDQGRSGASRALRAALVVAPLVVLGALTLTPARAWSLAVSLLGAQIALIITGRLIESRWLHRRRTEGFGLRRTLIIMGAGAEPMLYQLRRHPGDGFLVVGYLRAHGEPENTSTLIADLTSAVRTESIDTVMALGGLASEELVSVMRALESTSARLVLAPGLQDVVPSRMTGLNVTHGWSGLIDIRLRRTRLAAKAVADRILGTILLAVAVPILFVVGVAIRLDSPGPVFYTQTRVGRHGRHFTLWKLRSMYIDSDQRRAAVVAAHGDAGNEVMFKSSRDPRITRVGHLIRRTSIDELPQLINVVRGEMSLVGPRPALPEEVARYDQEALRRLLVKPGLTGLWQVEGRSSLSWESTVALDRHYVDNVGAELDSRILAATFKAVLGGRGAY